MNEFQQKGQNHFTFQIKNPGSTKNKGANNMFAMKKIQNYSYALSDQIGLGFTSHVYKGKCDITNKDVAVKVIELKTHAEDDLQANFLKQEVAVLQLIKNADSTNLLKLEKVIQTKNNLYIITEFCEGNDVAKILRKKKLFSEVEAQSIMRQILNGYKELYSLGIVHRDLKLANLFITKGRVKIADFGFAISQRQCKIKMDYNVGSPYYMPPQSLKHNEYSYLSDVWGMGAIAYQLVYGRVPWKDRDDHVLYDMILGCPVERLFDTDKQVSQHYKRFIKACLVVDKRFRATPQFIINYQWPFARQFVEGLQDNNNQVRNSFGGIRSSFPRLSLQRPELHKIVSDNSQQKKLMRRRTPSVDNLRTLVKSDQINPIFRPLPPRTNNFVSKSFIQPQKIIVAEASRQKLSRGNSNSRQSARSGQYSTNQTQIALVGQIHYCRFLFQLHKILQNNFPKDEQMKKVSKQISTKIFEKMKNLVKIAQNQVNNLNSAGFQEYTKTQRWQSLRQVIYKYDISFREELNVEAGGSFKNMEDPTFIIRVVKNLKENLPNNMKILQLLIYYVQLRDEQVKLSAYQLQQKMKLQYLVDQCRYYSKNSKQMRKNEQMQNMDRLLRKISILGL